VFRQFRGIGIVLTLSVFSLACAAVTGLKPTATLAPTVTPIPGWAKFGAGAVELWLPESFQGGDLSNDLDVIVGRLKAMGPEYETIAKTIEQNPGAFVLLAFDSSVGDSGSVTNVTVAKEKVLSSMTIETCLDAMEKQLPASFTVVERDTVQLEPYLAGRVVAEMRASNVAVKELFYLVKQGNVMWLISYATGQSEFESRLPQFEQSIRTLRLQP